MSVTVHLFAMLREQRGESRLEVDLRSGETVRELFDVCPEPLTQLLLAL